MVDPFYNLEDKQFVSSLDELPLWSAPFGLRLLEKIPMVKGQNVLDIGSGTGFPLIEIAMRLGPDSKITGLDPWTTGIDRIQDKIRNWNLTNVEMVQGVAENMPFGNQQFDLIVSNNGLNNVSDLNQSFRQIKRVGKTGSKLIFTMNTAGTMQNFYEVFREVLRRSALDERIIAMNKHIEMKRPSENVIEELLESCQIRLVEKEYNSFDFRYTNGSAFLGNGFIRMAFLPSWLELLHPEEQLPVFKEIEKELNVIAKTHNEFRTTIPFILFDCLI